MDSGYVEIRHGCVCFLICFFLAIFCFWVSFVCVCVCVCFCSEGRVVSSSYILLGVGSMRIFFISTHHLSYR